MSVSHLELRTAGLQQQQVWGEDFHTSGTLKIKAGSSICHQILPPKKWTLKMPCGQRKSSFCRESNPPMSWRICYFPLISNAVAFHTVILWKTWLRSGRCWRIVCTILEFELHLTDKCFRDATLLNFSQQLCAFGRLPKSCWKSFGWRKKFTGMNFAVCESTKFNVLASGSFVIFVSNFCNTYSDIPPPRRWTTRQIRQ